MAVSTIFSLRCSPLACEQDKEVERDWEGIGCGVKRRWVDAARVRPHQHRIADARTFEDRTTRDPRDCWRPNVPPRRIDVAAAFSLMLLHQREGMVELDQMIWAGIDHREPTPRPEHSRRLGEILWREDADYEIGGSIPNRPFCPQIGNGKSVLRPAPRGSTGSFPGNVEAQAYYRCMEHGGNPDEVIAGAKTRINHAPAPSRRLSAGSQHACDDRGHDGVKMTTLQE